MGIMTANAINSSITSLKNQDSILAEKIIENDKDINIKQTKIEDMCVLLIAREQPVAGDLRKIITALKIVIQLERIGDYAVNIANAALRLADEKYIKPLIDIPEMGHTGIKMLNGALEAYMENNAEKAKQISVLDDGIDKLYEQLLRNF
jgi:phosphate transport system protein